ncbi:ATP-binding protein [Streptomyces halstedii]|uniref:ATP-binding protein n=1 Tax=Streptomyces halstedii TaxID=1944 RepID=A0ABS6TVA1_STRHA|nr:AAA family ATPase [Streptomyces halstedii]MBV7672212.1 ATP-binding protein [Streptomyces halstedii]
MIIWVNGAFGSGKTTLVDELHRRRPDALVYDPEHTGFVLRNIVREHTGDFQDLPLWRSQVVGMALDLVRAYGRPVLAPMTVVDPGYAEEIFGALESAGTTVHHFFLDVPAHTLEARLDARTVVPGDAERDERVRRWGKAQIPRCVAAASALRPGTVRLDGERTTGSLADEVMPYLS